MAQPTEQQPKDLTADPGAPPQPTKKGSQRNAAWWMAEVERSVKHWRPYVERAKKVVQRYRDERSDFDTAGAVVAPQSDGAERFNILYANVETLRSAVYSRVPTPDIRRRFADRDPVGRVAADVLQRCVQYSIEAKPDYDFNGVLAACNEDCLLPGFAVARAVYRPYFKKEAQTDPTTGQELLDEKGKPVMVERKVYEEAACVYVQWDMFTMSRVKRFDRVWWEGFAIDMTRDEVAMQFGDEVAARLSYAHREKIGDKEVEDGEGCNTARIWEVWNKRDRERYFVSEGQVDFLMREDDPLRLEGMFPNPRPLWTISTNGSLIPIPEYVMYQDQALELDVLTQRIQILTKALKRRGVYDQKYAAQLQDVATAASDNCFMPIEQFSQLVADGGLEKVVMEMPIDGIVNVLEQLYRNREQTKQMVFEVTGIADIIRGSSVASETATAQQIKGQWAGLRLQDRKQNFARFARDLIRLKAEIIAEHFSQETMAMISGVDLYQNAQEKQAAQQQFAMAGQQAQQNQSPPPQMSPEEKKKLESPTWDEVLQVLRNDKLRGFKIDIETDSTVQVDADSEKAARTEFLGAVSGFIQQAGGAVQAGYMPKEMAREFLTFGARAFRVGSQLEQSLDAWGEEQEQGGAEDPKMAQKQAELDKKEAELKEAEHKAQLAAKDAQIASEKLDKKELEIKYREDILALKQQLQSLMASPGGVADIEPRQTPNQGPPL